MTLIIYNHIAPIRILLRQLQEGKGWTNIMPHVICHGLFVPSMQYYEYDMVGSE